MGGSVYHFGSEGKYYSYGKKGSCGMIGTSSVGHYVHRSYKDKLKLDKSIWSATIMEEMISKQSKASVGGIARIILNIRKLIAPIINIANHEQVHKGDINLKNCHSLKMVFGNPVFL